MRILLIGQAAFGAKVLEELLENREKVVGVYSPPDTRSRHTDPLKEAAVSHGIPLFQPKTFKDERVFDEYRELTPDLTVMAFVTDIIPAHFFEVPYCGAINYHPSLLPRHRGASAINWAVIMGDTRTGLTIFWPDGGIDTGPLLLQEEIEIGPEDTTGSLYFDHLFPMGVEALVKSTALIKQGMAPRIPQNEAHATYEQPCDDRVAGIDWDRPGQEIYNVLRGCDPQPGAYFLFKGEKIRCYDTKLIFGSTDEAAGTVLGINDQSIHVAVSGGRLMVGRVRTAQGKKIPAADWAFEGRLKTGDRLGSGLQASE
jgi:methionyl-tRNA formyltransferase